MIHQLKPLIVDNVREDRVEHSILDGLEARAKLLNDGPVTTMKRMKEEHNQQIGWDDHFATGKFDGEAIKP